MSRLRASNTELDSDYEGIQDKSYAHREYTPLLGSKSDSYGYTPKYSYISCRWFFSTHARLCSFLLLLIIIVAQAVLAGLSWSPTSINTVTYIHRSNNPKWVCIAAPTRNSTIPNFYTPSGWEPVAPLGHSVPRCSPLTMEVYNTIAAILLILIALFWYIRKWFVEIDYTYQPSEHCFLAMFALPFCFLLLVGWAVVGWMLSVHTGIIAYGMGYGNEELGSVIWPAYNPLASGAPYNGTALARSIGMAEAVILSLVSVLLWSGLFGNCFGCCSDFFFGTCCGDVESVDCSYASCGVSVC